MKSIKQIKALTNEIWFECPTGTWKGYTNDSMSDIVKYGYADIYPLIKSVSSKETKWVIRKCELQTIPLSRVWSLKNRKTVKVSKERIPNIYVD